MKKTSSVFRIMTVLLAAIVVLGTSAMPIYAAKPAITAEAVILIDAETGNVLFEKNPDKKMYPASTTKIMTALVALEAVENEEISLSQPLTMTQEILDGLDIDGSSIA